VSCRPGGPVRVAGDGEDEEDEQLRRRRRIHVRTRLHLPAAALSTSHAASCCDLHEPGLAHELMCRGDTHVLRWAPPRPMDHLLTTYHISTPTYPLSLPCVDLITLHQCPFKSALGRLRLLKCAMRRRGPAAQSQQHRHYRPHPTPLQPHLPAPTNPPAPCPSTTPGIYKASAWVRAPGGSITLPPPPPPERVRVEGAYFALGTS
jgi:hypothetical protein